MKDWKRVVAFDVDDTLLVPNVALPKYFGTEVWVRNDDNIEAFNWYKQCWCHMIVWSGTWVEWAEKWAKEFDLEYDEIREKKKYDDVDISVDDCVVDLAKVNIKVKRINNSISREKWNKEKHI